MSVIRDIQNKARRDIHDKAAVPALYIAQDGVQPLLTRCRVHPKGKFVGALPGVNRTDIYARMAEQVPELIFLEDESPSFFRQGAMITISATEAYRVETSDQEGIEITVRAAALTKDQAAILPHPDSA